MHNAKKETERKEIQLEKAKENMAKKSEEFHKKIGKAQEDLLHAETTIELIRAKHAITAGRSNEQREALRETLKKIKEHRLYMEGSLKARRNAVYIR